MSDSDISTEPEINPIVAKLSDFSDRLSPMIVKELRQGLRTRTFSGTFLILQVILAFGMLGAMLSTSSNTGVLISSMVFFLFSTVALIFQPLRGVYAVSTELKDDTLEIMSLTRLSSMRIVYGKWASIVGQTILMLTAVIPYLVLRYFFGGMQLFAELSMLFTVFFLSACMTAVTVGVSCSSSVVLRAIVPLALIPGGFMVISGMTVGHEFGALQRVFSFQDKETNIVLLVFAVVSTYVGYYFLDMGVSRIAPLAENHSLRKRSVSLLLMCLILVILFLNPPAQMGSFAVMLIFMCTIGLDVCTEKAVTVPSTVLPYVKRGGIIQLIGRYFFYPGWHSGFLLLSLMFGATFLVAALSFREYPAAPVGLTPEISLVIIGVFYTIVTPLLVIRIFAHKIKDPFPFYILTLILSGFLTTLVGILGEVTRTGTSGFQILMSWVPGVWLFFLDSGEEIEGLFFTGTCLAVVYVLLVVMAQKEFRLTYAIEARAKRSLEETEES